MSNPLSHPGQSSPVLSSRPGSNALQPRLLSLCPLSSLIWLLLALPGILPVGRLTIHWCPRDLIQSCWAACKRPRKGSLPLFSPSRPWSQRMWGSESPGPHPVGIACAPSASVTGVSSMREERSLPNHGVSTAGSQEELRKHLLTKREWSFGSHRQAF